MTAPARSCVFLLLAGVLALAGCGGRAPSTHYYVLEPDNPAGVAPHGENPSGWTIGVEPFRVDPPYDQDRIVYRPEEGAAGIGFYAYHRWAAPLGRMLPQVVVAEFAGAAGVGMIEPFDAGRSYAARMSGRVLLFEEVDTVDGPAIRVRFSLVLTDADETVIWSATLENESDVSTAKVAAIVEQMRGAVVDALAGSRADLETALSRRGGS